MSLVVRNSELQLLTEREQQGKPAIAHAGVRR